MRALLGVSVARLNEDDTISGEAAFDVIRALHLLGGIGRIQAVTALCKVDALRAATDCVGAANGVLRMVTPDGWESEFVAPLSAPEAREALRLSTRLAGALEVLS